jgi:hypothetical protein
MTKQNGIGPSVEAMQKPDSPLRRFGVATRALATAFPVAACGVTRRQQCGARRGRPAQRARGRSSAPPQPRRTGERFLDLSAAAVREQDAKTP